MTYIIIEGKGKNALKFANTLWNKSGEKFTEKEMKKMGFAKKKGWRMESARHALAAKGIKTKGKKKGGIKQERKFKIGDIVEIYPNLPDLKGKGKIVGYQINKAYFVKAISGNPLKEFGEDKKLTYYNFELKKVK